MDNEANNKVRIRMAETVRGSIFSKFGTVLTQGKEYDGISNSNGEILGLCVNGEYLGVKPGEFEFVEAPEWVMEFWAGECSV